MKWKSEFQERKLDDLFRLFQSVQDEELKAYLAKFLCVRASGFIETSFKNLVNDYISGTCPKPIERYVSIKVKGITNLNYERLMITLRSLNIDWAAELEAKTTEEQRSALNSVISNRNNIAHGENDSISYELMKGYYKSIKEVVSHLKKIIRK
jgi:hypothetical protein